MATSGQVCKKTPPNLISESFPAPHSPAGHGDFPAQPQDGLEGQGWLFRAT